MASKRASTEPVAKAPPPTSPAPAPTGGKRALTSRERARLRGLTMCDERTIRKWWNDPADVHPAIADRLAGAAVQAGVKP